MTRTASSTMAALLCLLAFETAAEPCSKNGAWPRHVIDNTSSGADGTKVLDLGRPGVFDAADLLVVPWEEGGQIRLYRKNGTAWQCASAGRVDAPEDAHPVDLDGDGFAEIVSSSEDKDTGGVYLHWCRQPTAERYWADPCNGSPRADSCWRTKRLSAAPRHRWMQATTADFNGDGRIDVAAGAKLEGHVGWFEAPPDFTNVDDWKYRVLVDPAREVERTGEERPSGVTKKDVRTTSWVMDLDSVDLDGNGHPDIVVTDRRLGLYWLPNSGGGKFKERTRIVADGISSFKFGQIRDDDSDGKVELLYPRTYDGDAKDGALLLEWSRSKQELRERRFVPLPPSFDGGVKSVARTSLDDTHDDYVFSRNGADGCDLALAFMRRTGEDTYQEYPIDNGDGVKYDFVVAIDVDEDGDVDILTSEENFGSDSHGLGVVWYENTLNR